RHLLALPLPPTPRLSDLAPPCPAPPPRRSARKRFRRTSTTEPPRRQAGSGPQPISSSCLLLLRQHRHVPRGPAEQEDGRGDEAERHAPLEEARGVRPGCGRPRAPQAHRGDPPIGPGEDAA